MDKRLRFMTELIGIFNRSHYEEVLVVRVHQNLLAAERMPAVGGEAGAGRRGA